MDRAVAMRRLSDRIGAGDVDRLREVLSEDLVEQAVTRRSGAFERPERTNVFERTTHS